MVDLISWCVINVIVHMHCTCLLIHTTFMKTFLDTKYQLLKDLSNLAKLLNVCASKLETNSEYSEILCTLLELCSLPFLKEKASDENTYAPQMIEMLTTFGQLVCGENDAVRAQIAKTIASFYTQKSSEVPIEGELLIAFQQN